MSDPRKGVGLEPVHLTAGEADEVYIVLDDCGSSCAPDLELVCSVDEYVERVLEVTASASYTLQAAGPTCEERRSAL